MSPSRAMDHLVAIAAIAPEDITTDARAMARLSLFDWMMVARAGAGQPVSRIIRDFVAAEGGRPMASIAGSMEKYPARAAALANGTISHALDYDDTHFAHVGHLSVGIMPAALAAAEEADAAADVVCDAFLVGAEAAVRLGVALGRGHYEKGFHQTATAGAFGATVAAGRIHRLTRDQMRMALSLVSTRVSGLKSQFGTMGKPFNAGIAAANGIEAAALARRGFVSCDDGVGGLQGFIATHADAPLEFETWHAGHFLFMDNSYKFHACCHGTHAMIEALLEAKRQWASARDGVQRVELHVNPRWLRVCDIKAPRSGLELKFSYGFLAAMVLAGIDTSSESAYTDGLCGDASLCQLAQRVTVIGDGRVSDTATCATITLADGSRIETSHDLAVPLPIDAISRRLCAKTEGLLGAKAAGRLWAAIEEIDGMSARELAAHLNG